MVDPKDKRDPENKPWWRKFSLRSIATKVLLHVPDWSELAGSAKERLSEVDIEEVIDLLLNFL